MKVEVRKIIIRYFFIILRFVDKSFRSAFFLQNGNMRKESGNIRGRSKRTKRSKTNLKKVKNKSEKFKIIRITPNIKKFYVWRN